MWHTPVAIEFSPQDRKGLSMNVSRQLVVVGKLASVILAASLAACGGGADSGAATGSTSGGSSTTTTSTTPQAAAVATSVPTPTYNAQSVQMQMFNMVNTYRNTMGVGMLRQDTLLDVSAQAHADYLNTNGTTLGHQEDATKPGFTGVYPRDRATAANVPAGEWVGELISGTNSADSCVNSLLDTVYHLQAMTANQETMGLGFNMYCVFEMGTITGETSPPNLNSIPVGGGQQMAANAIAYAPLSGEVVGRYMVTETPEPQPDIANPGHPLMVRVRADSLTDVLSVQAFTLVDNTGAAVPGRILVSPNAQTASVGTVVTDSGINPGVAFFLPTQPLGSNMTYTATFSGARNGTPISTSWSFKTIY